MELKNLFKPKIIFSVLGVILLVELIFAIRVLTKPVPQAPAPAELLPLTGGKIALTSSKKTYQVGEDIQVSVRIFTGGQISLGSDAIISYDPKILEAKTSSITLGKIYSEYPTKEIDPQSGTVRISGIASLGGGFNGVGELAKINFKGKRVGQTLLKLSFTKDQTTDSNIAGAREAQDILGEVLNLTLVISSISSIEEEATCSPRVHQTCVDAQGRSGTYWCTSIQDPLFCEVGCFTKEKGLEQDCSVVSIAP